LFTVDSISEHATPTVRQVIQPAEPGLVNEPGVGEAARGIGVEM
jgi:hypothetical protein